ncbi:MAG: L,D-transpeptidase [Firmicutes bacterium]|nr:L,D-transpeptidase [Bacillota bacterium]
MIIKKGLRLFFLCLGLLLSGGDVPATAADNPWTIMINIPECRLYLYHDGKLLKIYKVAVGKMDTPSPVGDFHIVNKVINPTWYPENGPAIPPGPNNPLGKYWMGLNNKGYGIHGNSAAWSIGAPASQGCFRMDNQDIGELFATVPVGTPVKVCYQIVKGRLDHDNRAWLNIFPDIYRRVDLEMTIKQVLTELNWEYEPHYEALQCLIKTQKPLTITVPRRIIIKQDHGAAESDGFYWNGRVYLRRNVSGLYYPSGSMSPENDLFPEYFPIDGLDEGAKQSLEWSETTNTLTINSVKVLINGEILEGAGLFGEKGRPLISYLKLCKWLDGKGLPQPVSIINTPDGDCFAGEYLRGELWIDLESLAVVSREFFGHRTTESGKR